MTTSPIDKGAAALGKTPSTPVTKKNTTDLNELMKIYMANNNGSASASKGPVYTKQDADAAVQGIWQQLFGKNAMGVDYNNAVKAYLNQSQDTEVGGRGQAIMNYAQSTPEFKAQQEDTYLDAIYNAIDANVRKARA